MYQKWANTNNFDSMLPQDTKDRRKVLADELLQQTSVDDHFKPTMAEEKPTPYSDENFKEAAIKWLIETSQVRNSAQILNRDWCPTPQPIQAFKHPKFQKMVNIAARSTCGVKFPSQKQTHQEIIKQFKEQMKALKECLNVSVLLTFILRLSNFLCRVLLSVVKLVWLTTCGQLQMGTATLQQLVTGLKSCQMVTGSKEKRSLGLCRWTPLMTAFNLAKPYTKFAISSALCIRCDLFSYWFLFCILTFRIRLGISPATMPPTIQWCWKNSCGAISWRQGQGLMWQKGTFGESNYFFSPGTPYWSTV